MADQPRFQLLGPVHAWRGDREIALGSPQQRALLAFLLLQDGTPVPVSRLTSALWGDEPPPAAVGIVRSYVSRLRRALGAAAVESVAGGYAVHPGATDVREFERLLGAGRSAQRSGDAEGTATAVRAALALWRGTPLAGIAADFAEFERVRLAELRLAAREDLAAADIAAGRPALAVADLTELIAEQPLRERPHELLMLALYRSGRQADALAVFADIQRRLADELGLYPGADLRAMQRRILAADPTLDAVPGAGRPGDARPGKAAAFAVRPCQLPPDLPLFAGRRDEIDRVAAALTPSGASVPVVGIEGLAGIGKTAFAVHLGRTRGDFRDGHLFVDLGTSADPLAELLHGIGVPAAELPGSQGERATLWRTLTSGRRLLVVLDDATDGGQLRPLMPGSGGAAVVVTARQRVYGVPAAQWFTLGPLAEADAHALLESLVGVDRLRREPDAVGALLRGTAGLPQVVRAIGERIASRPEWSMADALRRLGPPSRGAPVSPPECTLIEAPYASMLARLTPEQARAFLVLAAADVAEFSAVTAAGLLDVPPGAAAALIESLADQHVLTPTGPLTYAFPAPLRVFARGRLPAGRGHELIGAIA
ncbi:AfsR/SARP family transcriptional regulator [Jiangella rhizosphaerae]|uniref:AfsR/SARP family transcriptional regulator n=1 Tax=Jiangella rhizosphaerae TaxID=2293569 RepID=UPI0013140CB0|nr:AfsR/SARP family transcriptional regulator [Jiangella rhizosphaerae]